MHVQVEWAAPMRFQGRSPKGATVTMESGGTDVARGEGLTADQLRRAVALSVDKYCSVAAMLAQSAELSTETVVE